MIDGPGGFEGPYDEGEFLDRIEGDRELGQEIMQMFLGQCPGTLSDIGEALNSGDLDSLGRLAHSIKGTVGIFGARDSVSAALELETAARDGDMGTARQAWARLELEINRLTAALQEKVGGTAPCDF
jgi:two-component system, sensor histidine kinase and response regulator